jgi:hypothetical protein
VRIALTFRAIPVPLIDRHQPARRTVVTVIVVIGIVRLGGRLLELGVVRVDQTTEPIRDRPILHGCGMLVDHRGAPAVSSALTGVMPEF